MNLLGTFDIYESQDTFNQVFSEALAADRMAEAAIKEAYSSDQFAPFFANAAQPIFEEEYESGKDTQIWRSIAKEHQLSNFRPAEYLSLQSAGNAQLIDNGGLATPKGSLPLVPELTPYPTFGYSGTGRFIDTKKHGARINFSFEAFINDDWELIKRFPLDAAKLALHTEDVAVLLQLLSGTGLRTDVFSDGLGTTLQASNNTNILSAPINKNAPLSHDAVLAAIHQAKSTKRDGSSVSVPNGWYLVVSPALGSLAEGLVKPTEVEVTRGSKKFKELNALPGKVDILETPWMSELGTDTAWMILPKGGETSAKTTLVKTGLRGYEKPELRVNRATGDYMGGGQVAWTEGSFDNDDAEARVRLITGSGLINVDGIIGSTGLGS